MIEMLKGPDRIRRRANIVFDPLNARGCLKALKMLLENAVDEMLLGYGSTVSISQLAGNAYEIADSGRGMDFAHWEEAFCAMYPDGISEKDTPLRQRYQADSYRRYCFHLAAVQCVCRWMEVETCRDGQRHFLRFEKGYPKVEQFRREDAPNAPTGTRIRFQPDSEIFTDITIPVPLLEGLARQTALAVPGLEIILHTQPLPFPPATRRYCYSQGIADPSMESFYWEGTVQEINSAGHAGAPYEAKAEAYFAFSDSLESVHIHNHRFLGGSLVCSDAKLRGITLPEAAVQQALKTVCNRWYPGRRICTRNAAKHLQLRLRTYAQKTFFADENYDTIRSKALEAALLPALTEALVRYLEQNRPRTEQLLEITEN